jgi:hypothetical protein
VESVARLVDQVDLEFFQKEAPSRQFACQVASGLQRAESPGICDEVEGGLTYVLFIFGKSENGG